jgi:hypothetical protein
MFPEFCFTLSFVLQMQRIRKGELILPYFSASLTRGKLKGADLPDEKHLLKTNLRKTFY